MGDFTMKRRISLKNILGVLVLVVFAGFLVVFGYKVIVNANNLPGKLSSIPDSLEQMNHVGNEIVPVQKVAYEVMKYGYMDDLMLARMDYVDRVYESERMEEVRAVNNLTAMSEKTESKLAYEEAAKEIEKRQKEAEAALYAARAAREAKIKEIADRENGLPFQNSEGGENTGGGSGSTASKGGKKGEPVYATKTGKSLGTFVITAYCTCRICCGVYSGHNRTASGTVPTANRTIAVDTNVIPFGTRVVINGQVYVAEDRGGAIKGNRIDMFFMTHKEALNWGRKSMEVYLAE